MTVHDPAAHPSLLTLLPVCLGLVLTGCSESALHGLGGPPGAPGAPTECTD